MKSRIGQPRNEKALLRSARILTLALIAFSPAICGPQIGNAQDEADQTTAPVKQDLPTQQEIATMVENLGADTFAERQQAMRGLMKCGVDAVGPLELAIEKGEPETQMRAISVIGRLATEPDETCRIRAREALEKLARSENPDISRLAVRANEKFGQAMQDRAIEELVRLGADVQPVGVAEVKGQKTMQSIVIQIGADFQGTKKDFVLLNWLMVPTNLTMLGESIDDEVIAQMTSIPKLHWLTIKRGAISNAALTSIARIDSLNRLYLYYLDVDDKGMDAVAGMDRLNELRLYGTQVTSERAEILKTEMAGTNIDWRLGAFLGIYYNNLTEGPCLIDRVVTGSAAEISGLKAGDVVLSFAGKKITTALDFQGAVSPFRPGDKVTAVVQRDDEKLELEIELGSFPNEERFQDR